MAINVTDRSVESQRGFALLIAVIFMSTVLALGLALGSLGYKQQIIASSAVSSQLAFYVADAGLECGLYADQQENLFNYNANLTAGVPRMKCDGDFAVSSSTLSHTSDKWVTQSRFSMDNATHCVDVTVYKFAAGGTYVFSQGYDVACPVVETPNGARFTARGVFAHY